MPHRKYNATWETDDPLHIELGCICRGGRWRDETGEECGAGMIDHLMNARKLAWPDRYRHRWTDLMYHEFVQNDITILMGAASTQKTSHASEFVLLNYWARPKRTLVVMSTVTMDRLDTGVFGEVKMLWQQAREKWPDLAGHLLENKRAILTDNLKQVKNRDMRKGIIGRACYIGRIGGKYVGLGVLAGTKQEYIFYLCDEIQFMAETFIRSWPNLFSNGNVKIIGSGNPKHDPDDQLGIAAEPKEGWATHPESKKTECWDTQFLNGRCVNLVGTDSPNFDVPATEPEPYPKLIGRKFINRIINDWGENSPEYYTQCKGVMRIDMADERVITRQLCRQHQAHDAPVWRGTDRIRVYGLDPSYSGAGDLCIAIPLEFGSGDNGLELIAILEVIHIVIDVRIIEQVSAEDQVAARVESDLRRLDIPPENAFYDPYGKGTMGSAFARRFGANSPFPVDSGGQPTERPVRMDLFVFEEDGKKRLKTCREHYSKFVTEAWYSVRYSVEANQLRNLPVDVMMEGCARKCEKVAGNKWQVEAKEDYKLRMGHSPNKFDALAVAMEGARQRGFQIARLGANLSSSGAGDDDWAAKEAAKYQEAIQKGLLVHNEKQSSWR